MLNGTAAGRAEAEGKGRAGAKARRQHTVLYCERDGMTRWETLSSSEVPFSRSCHRSPVKGAPRVDMRDVSMILGGQRDGVATRAR